TAHSSDPSSASRSRHALWRIAPRSIVISLRFTAVQPSCAPGRGVDSRRMSRRLPLYVLLAGALAVLASLYLTWTDSAASVAPDNPPLGLLDLVSGFSQEGWGTYGQAGALVALALAAAAAASLVRPQLETRLPLAAGGLALLFFAVLNAAELH